MLFLMERISPQSRSMKPRWIKSDKVADVVDKLGGESLLAAMILRQAVEDLRFLRAGKRCRPDLWPNPGRGSLYSYDPFGELHAFFSGEWFAFLSEHLGLEPSVLLRHIER